MNYIKNSFSNIVPVVILISIISLDILLIIALVNVFFNPDGTIIAGVIAFAGAIIGGAITLIGVLISIEHNQKLRMKDNIPDKINRIESSLSKLEEIIENGLNTESTYYEDMFISLNFRLDLVRRVGFARFTKDVPEELKENFIYIDADAYRMYLNFRDKVELLGMKLNNDAEMMLDDLKEATKDEDPNELMQQLFLSERIGIDEYRKQTERAEYVELAVKYFAIVKELLKKNAEFTFHLEIIYKDLHVQLTLKHEQLINELDY